MSLLIALVLSLQGQSAASKPKALLAFEAARRDIRTADVEWSYSPCQPESLEGGEWFYRTRVSPHNSILVRRGDRSGVVRYDQAGLPSAYDVVEMSLDSENSSWEYQLGCVEAMHWPDRRSNYECDVLSIGIIPRYDHNTSSINEIWKYPDPSMARKYSETKKGNLVIVTAHLAEDYKLVWELDPSKAWNAVAVREVIGDAIECEAICALKQYDGIWFPELVTHYVAGEKTPWVMIRVYSASFNRPSHPQRFEPKDIGIEPGLSVSLQKSRGKHGAQPVVWDGCKIVSRREFDEARREGMVKRGPNVERMYEVLRLAREDRRPINLQRPIVPVAAEDENQRIDANAAAAREMRQMENEWERYTRQFIARHGMDDPQTTSALAVLKDCTALARPVILKNRERLAKIDQLFQSKASGAPDEKERTQALADKRTLLQPLDDIFQKQLKPRLDALLTADQRAKAQATAQPEHKDKPG